MIVRVYRTTGQQTRSIWQAELVAEVETDKYPDDPQEFADEYGGDFIEVDIDSIPEPLDLKEEANG